MTETRVHRSASLIAVAVMSAPLTGCVTVKPPDKPIEINLNVKIEQEVLVRLQRDVEQIIRENPETFPQTPPRPGTRR